MAKTLVKKIQMSMVNAEIKAENLTDSGNVVDCGKMFVDDSNNLDVSCAGLMTTAKTFKGAINELFQQGGDTTAWTPPTDWLTLPQAGAREIYILVGMLKTVLATSTYNMNFTFISATSNISATVDWGDGTPELRTQHYENTYNNYLVSNSNLVGTDKHVTSFGSRQIIIKITLYNDTQIQVGSSDGTCRCLMASIGSGIDVSETMFNSSDLYSVEFINSTITEIGRYAFNSCQKLIQIIGIPSTVTVVRDSAFSNCYALKSISLVGLETAEYGGFNNCRNLRTLNAPSLATVGTETFCNCYSLKSLDLSKSEMAVIPESCCSYCCSLQTVTLPAAITQFGNYAFENCTSLREINIAEGATFGTGAFSGCSLLGY